MKVCKSLFENSTLRNFQTGSKPWFGKKIQIRLVSKLFGDKLTSIGMEYQKQVAYE